MRKVAILQSNYIPWKGYFDLIASVDEFILYDDMQYTRRDWRNRNRIKTPNGKIWLTVPVKVKGKYFQTIRETEIDGDKWRKKHWDALCLNYKKAAHFEEIIEILQPIYLECDITKLSELNRTLIETICRYLGIRTKISDSSDFILADGKTERLADLCRQAGATDYVSGPAARDYIEPEVFADYGIGLHWFDYAGYPDYPQLWGPFVHEVSVVDLLFNCGDEAPRYMKFTGRS